MSTPPLILLHGAWHSGAIWSPVVARLREQGFDVFAPDLPGHGASTLPLQKVSLRRYVESVQALLQELSAPAIVVGHSMAGMVLAQCSSDFPALIREAIYLCAYLPRDGESVFDLMALARAENKAELPIETALRMSEDKRSCSIDPAVAASLFYSDASTELAATAAAKLSVQATLPLAGKVKLVAENFAQVPRTYVCCTRDAVIPLWQQRSMLRRQSCQELLQIESDHSPFLSHTDLLVDLFAARLRAANR